MDVILMWYPVMHQADKYEGCIAINWENPDLWVNPMWFTPNEQEREWLALYDNPVFNSMGTHKSNVEALRNKIGGWPIPYFSDRFSLLPEPNDTINF